MNDIKKIRFKKSESFYIREGWLQKAINAIIENKDTNIFAKNNGARILGIGTNMVKSLRYWLKASDITKTMVSKTELTQFGLLLFKYDKYLESNFSWFFIHYFLVVNMSECPLFYYFFNSNIKSFSKKDAEELVYDFYTKRGVEIKKEYIDKDLSVFIKTYFNDNFSDNPEDNYVCPLSYLKLIKKNGDKHYKIKPIYSELSYLIIYFALLTLFNNKSFNIEDSIEKEKSPYFLFNLDKNAYLQYLEEMKRHGLITINKTAGLNTVYFEKKLSLEDIFAEYFGE